ncbi:hypothetical protein [Marininema halotolerans]|uniref:Uncharacterized protein n=1 Tax=Marininema halotolerans TaxID=1155944 RepID=A0A1I6U141_9BACL|nr:hypothetical protein [Marininema halotolerans]SFS95068.1 hypothetical protein SAMN05444972_11288 [Marininema halotolerans]
MARKILDYAATVPLSVQSGQTLIPTTPARLQLADVGVFIPPSAAGASRVEVTATVGILKNTPASTGLIQFRIFRDGSEIFNELQNTPSPSIPGVQSSVFTFDMVDFNLSQGFHIYSVTVESIINDHSVIGPITFSALAIGTTDSVSNDQVINYQASVPQSVQGVAAPVAIPASPARVQLAGLGVFIPQVNAGNNRVQLKATIGVQSLIGTNQYLFRIFRDGAEIFNTEASMDTTNLKFIGSEFHTIDFDVAAAFHVYSLTVENLTEGDAQVIGPIVFSGIVIGADTQITTNQNNQVLDYNASVPRSVQVTASPLAIPISPARLQLASTGIYIPTTFAGANRVQIQGTIGCLLSGGPMSQSQLLIRIFRDGGEIFNASYPLAFTLTPFYTIPVQTIDFNVSSLFHVYSLTIESTSFVGGAGQVIGPITFSALSIGPID